MWQLPIFLRQTLDMDKLKPVSVDLTKSSDLVDNDVFKKTVYD